MAQPVLTFEVLGPLRVRLDGAPVRITPKSRVILAALLLDAGRVVSVDRLVHMIWDEQPPDSAVAALHVHVSNLRRSLDRGIPNVVTQQPGYRIDATARHLDLLAFEDGVRTARRLRAERRFGAAMTAFAEALARWRGDALSDVDSTAPVAGMRAWLAERRATVIEEHAEMQLATHAYADLIEQLEPLMQVYPLRERMWEALIRGLYLSGRQADALATYRRARTVLSDQLGIDPRASLRDLERAILKQSLEEVEVPEARTLDLPPTRRVPPTVHARIRTSDGMEREIEDVFTIGRHPSCNLVVSDASVSRRHAEIRPVAEGCLLSDLGSSNGTRVRGALITQRLLQPGDVVAVGDYHFTFLTD